MRVLNAILFLGLTSLSLAQAAETVNKVSLGTKKSSSTDHYTASELKVVLENITKKNPHHQLCSFVFTHSLWSGKYLSIKCDSTLYTNGNEEVFYYSDSERKAFLQVISESMVKKDLLLSEMYEDALAYRPYEVLKFSKKPIEKPTASVAVRSAPVRGKE